MNSYNVKDYKIINRVYEKIKNYESHRHPTNLSFDKDLIDYKSQAKNIVLNYKNYNHNFKLAINDYDDVKSEILGIHSGIELVEVKLKKLPKYIKKYDNYPSLKRIDTLKKKLFSLSEELNANLDALFPLKTSENKQIALIDSSMRLWRRLGRLHKPKILTKESELHKYLEDIFKSFYLNEDIEYWYNKWSKIKDVT
jgi:hypothetical protein